MPKYSSSTLAEWAAPPEQQQQEIADNHWRQHERQVHHGVENALAGELHAREQQRETPSANGRLPSTLTSATFRLS